MVISASHRGLCCAFLMTHLTRSTVPLPTKCSTRLLFKFFILVISPTGFGCYHLDLQGRILLPTGRTSAFGALPDSLLTQEHIARLCFMRLLPHCVVCLAVSGQCTDKKQSVCNLHQMLFWDQSNGPLLCSVFKYFAYITGFSLKALFIILGTRKPTYGGRDHHGLP